MPPLYGGTIEDKKNSIENCKQKIGKKNDLRRELWFLGIWFSIMHTWYHGTRNEVNRPNKIHILCCSNDSSYGKCHTLDFHL